MKIRAVAIIALAVFLPVSAAACGSAGSDPTKSSGGKGDGSVGSMTVEELSNVLQKSGGLPKEQADCIAKVLDQNGLSIDDFQKAGSGDVTDNPKYKAYIQDSISCFGTTDPGS